jgi:hypothetical protein
MSTEYATKYENFKNNNVLDKNLIKEIGPKETSGFVLNKEDEDVLTGVPGERWLFKERETGISDYNARFLPYEYPKVFF